MNGQEPGHSPVLSSTGDPHHHRASSLGEMHQELEQEQEAQVNRLLQMIRSQQTQLQQLQQQQQQPSPQASASGTAVIDEASSTPQADLGATAFPLIPPLPAPRSRTSTLSSHRPSRRSSQVDASSSLHAESGAPGGGGGTDLGPRRSSRDESAFYQAEAAMLSRENQMLRQRIRDLERQLSESHNSHESVKT